ncbi:hypothetical protein ACFE04_012955 [Oxalis oulophora]
MDEILIDLMDILKKPTITETFVDILLCTVPIWLAVMIGLIIGWSWRPRWTGLLYLGFRSKFRFIWTAAIPPGFGARRLWLAFTALSAFSVCRTVFSTFSDKRIKLTAVSGDAVQVFADVSNDSSSSSNSSSGTDGEIVTENDLEHLVHLLEGKVGEMEWQNLMERSTPNMLYQAWRNELERLFDFSVEHSPRFYAFEKCWTLCVTGPTIYRSRTVFEDATPELVRDFFWDDEFRHKWDPMLAYFKTLEECPHNGTTIVHWIKKFPFFCSDREYIIGRRIWEAGKTYYCVTKGVPYSGLQKRDKPRRVELYFSSWVIRPVESRKGDGQMSACEVILVHYEDMGIPKDVAKLGVRHGMWGAVKKLHSGMRAYQNARKSESALSRSALMARITTKISLNRRIGGSIVPSEEEIGLGGNNDHGIDWKWVVLGGTVALVCGLHMGVIGKGLLLGAGQRFARR